MQLVRPASITPEAAQALSEYRHAISDSLEFVARVSVEVKALRLLSSLTMQQLADTTGVSVSVLSAVENGDRPLRHDEAIKVIDWALTLAPAVAEEASADGQAVSA